MATKSTAVKLTLKITSFVVRLLLNIVFYVLVVILIINISKKAFEVTYEIYGPVAVDESPGRDIIFQIGKGESKMDVATKLEVNRLIRSKYAFFLRMKLSDDVVMPGTYVINSSMTTDEILAVITDYSKSIVKEEEAGSAEGSDSDSNDGKKTEKDAETSEAGSDTEDNKDSDADADADAENASQ
jgi:UPF0755 protein